MRSFNILLGGVSEGSLSDDADDSPDFFWSVEFLPLEADSGSIALTPLTNDYEPTNLRSTASLPTRRRAIYMKAPNRERKTCEFDPSYFFLSVEPFFLVYFVPAFFAGFFFVAIRLSNGERPCYGLDRVFGLVRRMRRSQALRNQPVSLDGRTISQTVFNSQESGDAALRC